MELTTDDKVAKIYEALFVTNGDPCISERLRNVEHEVARLNKILVVGGTTIMGAIITLILGLLTHSIQIP